MLKPLRIAAVVPVYQEPLAIRRLINEFMSHIFANSDNVELFIFEDGSTDSTKEVLREFENQAIPRLHISISGKRKGYPTAARDAILSIDPSIYTHILFLDGDGQYLHRRRPKICKHRRKRIKPRHYCWTKKGKS